MTEKLNVICFPLIPCLVDNFGSTNCRINPQSEIVRIVDLHLGLRRAQKTACRVTTIQCGGYAVNQTMAHPCIQVRTRTFSLRFGRIQILDLTPDNPQAPAELRIVTASLAGTPLVARRKSYTIAILVKSFLSPSSTVVLIICILLLFAGLAAASPDSRTPMSVAESADV